MKKNDSFPKNVFISMNDLLQMESVARGFSFLANKQRVKSILGGKHASKLRGRGLDFEEVRSYVVGDDIRNIDWKVTARTQKTHLRVYSEEKEKPVLLIVDQTKSMFFGTKLKTKSVVAAELAALAAFRVTKEGDRVGGIVFGDEGIDVVLPKRNRKNILMFFEKLVKRNRELMNSVANNYKSTNNEVFKQTRNIVTHDYLVIIISDFQMYASETVKYIATIAQHNDVILAKVYDPMEKELMPAKFVGGDGQKQLAIDGTNSKHQTKFSDGFDTEFLRFEAEMKKHRIPVFKVNTEEDVTTQIREILKTRKS